MGRGGSVTVKTLVPFRVHGFEPWLHPSCQLPAQADIGGGSSDGSCSRVPATLMGEPEELLASAQSSSNHWEALSQQVECVRVCTCVHRVCGSNLKEKHGGGNPGIRVASFSHSAPGIWSPCSAPRTPPRCSEHLPSDAPTGVHPEPTGSSNWGQHISISPQAFSFSNPGACKREVALAVWVPSKLLSHCRWWHLDRMV